MATQENRGPVVLTVAATMFSIAAAAVLLRCFVRLRITKAFGTDDFFMIAAMVSFTLNTATCIAGVHYGTGRHMTELDPRDTSKAMMYWWYCYLTYATSMILSKTSIACFLLRLTPRKTHRWIIKIVIFLSVLWGVIFFFVAMLQCSPISYFWTRTGDGKCMSVDVIIIITYIYSGFSIVTDFTLTTLPIWLIWHLQMDMRTKIALIPIVSMAFVASCAVAVRLAYVQDFKQADFLYDTTDIAIWSQAEQGLAIAAGSLATLQPLFRMAMNKLGFIGSTQGRSAGREGAVPNGKLSERSSNSKSSGRNKPSSRQGPRSLFSLSAFTKMDEAEEVDQKARDEGIDEIHEDKYHGIRTSGLNDDFQYRVTIESNGQSRGWRSPEPVITESGSREQLYGTSPKGRQFDV